MAGKQHTTDELSRAVARLKAGILALLFGALGGLGLFTMTAWLLIENGPQRGKHLQLLGHYLVGYSVTWRGAFVGLAYGILIGGLFGWTIGFVYNRIVGIRHR